MTWEDRIQESIIRDIREVDSRTDAFVLPEPLARVVRALGSRSVAITMPIGSDQTWLLASHPDYADIWYCLKGHCPNCLTTVVLRKPLPMGSRFECGLCRLPVAQFIPEETDD